MKKIIAIFAVLVQLNVYAQITENNSNNSNNQIQQNKDTILPEGTFKLKRILITGVNRYSKQQIMRYIGLYEGDVVEIPGLQMNSVVKRLWESKLFGDVEIFLTKVEGQDAYIRINLKGLPDLGDVKIDGYGKSKTEKFVKDNDLKSKTKITENLRSKVQNSIKSKFIEKGFPDAQAIIQELPNRKDSTMTDWHIKIVKGPRVKVGKITVEGAKELKQGKVIARAFKNTKQKRFWRFWKKSKFIKDKYDEDLQKVIEIYQSYGFRDIKINDEKVSREGNNYNINLNITEGKKYYLGNINFVGNSAFSTETLNKILGYKKGDTYDVVGINKKVSGSDKDDDISTAYYDNGYVFSSIIPVEKAVRNDTIDYEIRIKEGEQATYNRVTFQGNTVTHDRVIARSLRTRPGDLFSKSEIKRTLMELAQMGYFEPNAIKPDPVPDPETRTVNLDWKLEEKGSSQVELQGGYGGGRFIGTLGLTFGNFAFNDFFKKGAWRPVPRGDGQSISLRAQAGSNYQNYSVSFTEPWIGGKRPTSLSVSFYNTMLRYNLASGPSRLNIFGAQVGITKMLNWPDSYFRFSHGINYQLYDFKNYPFNFGNVTLNDGKSNNINYYLTIGRYSAGLDPIFPDNGSDIELSAKFTPPYSLFNGRNYETISTNKKYEILEYYKIKFKAYWYQKLVDKFVLKMGGEFGFLGSYNSKVGMPPFERFYMGGTGLYSNRFDGREIVPLRGYKDATSYGGVTGEDITPYGGGTSYSKFMLELRYPFMMSGQTKIFGLAFAEGGNTWDQNKFFNPFDLKRSVGVGIRIFMPQFGMLGFDFANGLDSALNTGGSNGWETHFILGQQF